MTRTELPMKKTYLWIATIVALDLLGAWLFITHAKADEPWNLPAASCYPILSAITGTGTVIDARTHMRADTDVAIWWCEIPAGMEENYRTGNFGRPCEPCFREDITLDQLRTMDRVAFFRQSTAVEQAQVAKAEQLYEPRCVFATTAKTTQVLSATLDRTIGPARTDAAGKVIRWETTAERPSCWSWIVEGSRRWCSVTGLLDTAGREIGPDSYVSCKLMLAPEEGWK